MANVVLIHGMWSNSQTLEPLNLALQSLGHRVWAPDLPDHDSTSIDLQRLATTSIQHYVSHVETFVHSLSLDAPPVLIGHSMGGLIAQLVASKIKTGPLILLNPAPPHGFNSIYPSSILATLNVSTTWAFHKKSHKPPYFLARYGLLNRMSEAKARENHATMTPESGKAFREIVFWWWRPSRSPTRIDPRSITVPLFFISGAEDRIVVPRVTRAVSRIYDNAAFKCYSDHAHWLMGEPGFETIASDIHAWIQQHATIQ